MAEKGCKGGRILKAAKARQGWCSLIAGKNQGRSMATIEAEKGGKQTTALGQTAHCFRRDFGCGPCSEAPTASKSDSAAEGGLELGLSFKESAAGRRTG